MRVMADIRKDLDSGVYDTVLSDLYCRPAAELPPYRERISRVMSEYLRTFGGDEQITVGLFSAPGRTEIGGNHTDHQRGKVLTGSVDLDALACAAPNGSSHIRIFSDGYGMTEIDCSALNPVESEKNTTAAIIRGIAAKISQSGHTINGFNAFVTSDVPGGSGLSSSACFEVLTGTLMNDLFCGGVLTPVEIAQTGQYAENVYFGKPSGLLDQMGCVTFHGLRHTFAAEKYKMLIDGGMSELDAHFTVSCLLGHERADVTDIYLASVKKEARDGK